VAKKPKAKRTRQSSTHPTTHPTPSSDAPCSSTDPNATAAPVPSESSQQSESDEEDPVETMLAYDQSELMRDLLRKVPKDIPRVWHRKPQRKKDIFTPEEPRPTPGPNIDVENMSTIDIFLYFWGEVIDVWMEHTNNRGQELFGNKSSPWVPINKATAYRWFAVVLNWGISDSKTLRQPFSRKQMFGNPWFKQQMSGARFYRILR
jgi:hypothetical protein